MITLVANEANPPRGTRAEKTDKCREILVATSSKTRTCDLAQTRQTKKPFGRFAGRIGPIRFPADAIVQPEERLFGRFATHTWLPLRGTTNR
jgi:hypothetical protein